MRLNGFRTYRIVLAVVLALLLTSLGSPAHAQTNYTTSFTDLTFSATSDGPAMSYFPVGTTQVFARWNFQNVSPESRLRRQWFRDGVLFIQKEEAWTWGVNGRLSSISIYDFTEGLTPGNYHVVISLVPYAPAAQVIGDFVIAAYPSTVVPPSSGSFFSDLTMSTSATGPAMTDFPAGTPVVSARWNFANIPVGAVVQRDWYLNGVIFRSVQEPWSAYWGSSGRLTHIAIYDYERGLASGFYQVNIFLRDMPAVRATASFRIGQTSQSPVFSNLTFSATPNGPATAIFPRGTKVIYARWDFNKVGPENRMVRRWYRNGALWLEREEAWMYGPSGTVQNISIYDYDNGLLPGDYYVEIGLKGMPETLRGYFRIE
ncbi:MAG: hypothetical protein IT324_13630 [Anaerolineae bacterium]|nr:hypothetical protein [Anaerolineae bacterium]